jgi:tetratricopeptide (TPR) repeat protein
MSSRTEKIILTLLFVFLSGIFFAPRAAAQQAKTYEEAISKGNQLFRQKKYLDAKAYFQMALRYKVHDPVATQKIKQIVQQLKAGEAHQQVYYNIIDQADSFYDKDMLPEALKSYQKALEVIPGDSYALGRIKEIHRQMTLELKKLVRYQRWMKTGDSLLGQHLFNAAINAYEEAQNVFPNKPLAANKLILARQLQHNFINRKKQAIKEIETAGRYLLIKSYADALRHYEIADSLVPGNPLVVKRINQLRPQAQNQIEYNRVADEADRLYISKNYMAAREKYQQAQKLWPENSYPSEMIAKIDEQLKAQRKNL